MNINPIKAALLSTLITGVLFSLLTLLFTNLGILVLLHPVLAGISTFILPCLCLGLYHLLNIRFTNNDLEKYSLVTSNLLLGVCVALLFFGFLKWYTATVVFILFVLLVYIEYGNKLRFMYRFYRTYLILLVPFYLTCTLVLSKRIFKFDESATLQLKLIGLPIEAYFYLMSMLLMAAYLFELFKSKMEKVNG